MEKTKTMTRPVKININIEAPEAHKRIVTSIGTGGAHISFLKEYLGYEVLIIPLKKTGGDDGRKLAK